MEKGKKGMMLVMHFGLMQALIPNETMVHSSSVVRSCGGFLYTDNLNIDLGTHTIYEYVFFAIETWREQERTRVKLAKCVVRTELKRSLATMAACARYGNILQSRQHLCAH